MEVNSILSGVFGFFIVLFIVMQLLPRWLAGRMKGQQAPEMTALLNERQIKEPRLLLYFWSPSCGMCKSITPIVDELIKERDDVVSIDITQHLDLARSYRIMGTPAWAIVEQGIIGSISLGGRTRSQIMKLLEG